MNSIIDGQKLVQGIIYIIRKGYAWENDAEQKKAYLDGTTYM